MNKNISFSNLDGKDNPRNITRISNITPNHI